MGFWSIVNSSSVERNLETDESIYVISFQGVGYPTPNVVITPYGLVDGGLFQRRIFPPRSFSLICQAPGSSFVNMHTLRKNLEALVDHGTGAAVKVRYTNNSLTVEVDAHYTGGLEFGELDGFTSEFPLQFVAPDPFWKETSTNTTALNVGSSTSVTNSGTAPAYPTFTFEGDAEISSIANSTNSKTITFSGLIVISGETVTLDLSPSAKTLSSDVRGNLFNTIASGSDLSTWQLDVGSNSVTLTADTSGDIELLETAGGDALEETAGGDELLAEPAGGGSLSTKNIAYVNRHYSIDGVG